MTKRWIVRGIFILLLLLDAAGWVHSVTHSSGIGYTHANSYLAWAMAGGTIGFGWGHTDRADGWHIDNNHTVAQILRTREAHPDTPCPLGFTWLKWGPPSAPSRFIAVPFWFLILFSALGLFIAWKKTAPPCPRGAS